MLLIVTLLSLPPMLALGLALRLRLALLVLVLVLGSAPMGAQSVRLGRAKARELLTQLHPFGAVVLGPRQRVIWRSLSAAP